MKFKKLKDYFDILEIQGYIKQSENRFSDMTLASLFMWYDRFPVEYCIRNETLILKDQSEDAGISFCYPVGKDPEGAILEMASFCEKQHKSMTLRLMDQETAERLKGRYALAEIGFERKWSDYIYSAESLRSFSGRKLSGQRNHVNKFKKLYGGYEYSEMTEKDIPEVLGFFDRFESEHTVEGGIERDEFEASKRLCEKMFSLGLVGGYIRLGGEIIAISIGEILKDTLYVHVEKALSRFNGVYQVIVREFAEHNTGGQVIYINREDDSGDEGLRISKLQYHPLEVKNKYYVKVHSLIERINPPVQIRGINVMLDDIRKEDGDRFLRLSSDIESNKYWGYDYREDKNAEKTAEYFLGFAEEMKKNKEEYSLAIRSDDGFIGEAVLHNFDFGGGMEIGFRVLPEFRNKGYAGEAAKVLSEYAVNVLGAARVFAKRNKENEASGKVLQKAGFEKTGEDDIYIYYNYKIG